jgi:hypothetical protein
VFPRLSRLSDDQHAAQVTVEWKGYITAKIDWDFRSTSALRKNNPLYGPDRFSYVPESNSYRCPAGQQLNFVGLNVRNRTHAYIGSRKRCGACPAKGAMHYGPVQVSRHPYP